MRASLLLSILTVAAAGGCNQSLTGNMTGTGGVTGTGDIGAGGSGATGGSPFGAGGMGGGIVPSACSTLQAEYQSALAAAETCQVGAAGQCQQLASTGLSGCDCSTHVSDGSALAAIAQAWQAAGCTAGPRSTCGACLLANNTTCVSVDGGSLGFCSFAPGTGGTSGAGGATGAGGSSGDGGTVSCSQLSIEYAAVLEGAKSCTAGAPGQCAQSVPGSLGPCGGCAELVNDSSVLDALRKQWDAAGCGNVDVFCPQIACPAPTGAACLPTDAGGSACSAVHSVAPTG